MLIRKVIAVVGATGTGKTSLGLQIAKKFNGVILSADSRQVYRGLDRGTNKEGELGSWQGEPARFLDGIPQLLVDLVEPGERFTLADWLSLAKKSLKKTWKAGHLPIIVGGTGLYVTALLEGYELGGGRYSKQKNAVDFDSLALFIDMPKDQILTRSDQRIEKVFDSVVTEVKHLMSAKVTDDWFSSVGLDYRFAAECASGKLDRETAIVSLKKATKEFVRRQLTWWRHHGELVSITSNDQAEIRVRQFV